MSDRPEDELRPVTVLFADIVGSTALGEQLAPDEVKALVGECVSLMARSVEEYGGVVQAYQGDGICAYFGVPAAHEDDPERAARSGLRILEVVTDYARDIEAAWNIRDFSVRVGINTGQAGVGLVGGAETSTVALGDVTNVGARLQAASERGTITVGRATAQRLAGRFELEPLGGLTLKGRSATVEAYRLGRARVREAKADRPFVGRVQEVERLRGIIDELAVGRGQIVLLEGDPGIGKTRLLEEMRSIAGERVTWLEGQCLSYGGIPGWPFVEILMRWLGVEFGEAEISIRVKTRAKLEAVLGDEARSVVLALAPMLRLHLDEQPRGDPDAAYVRWIIALARERPVVVAIDDLQWADERTRTLAEALFLTTDRAGVALVMTSTPDPPREGAALRGLAHDRFGHRTTTVRLRPLDDEAASRLVEAVLGETDEVTRTRVIRQAEGNPLYLEELVRTLLDGGGVARRGRTWTITERAAQLLPPALENLLIARIDRLPPTARRVAQIAAGVGRTFPVTVVERVAEADISEDLSALLRAEIVREVRRFPEFECGFTHGLIQDAALSTLTATQRRDLYTRIAGAFEHVYATALEPHFERIAHYHAQSGNVALAYQYAERARSPSRS